MIDAFYRKLKEVGKKTGIAKGDNFVVAMLYQQDPNTRLFYDDGRVVTGWEATRHRDGASIKDSEISQPERMFFDYPPNENEYIKVIRPQRFGMDVRNGNLTILVGAGFDLEVHDFLINGDKRHLGRSGIPLNGHLSEPDKRNEIMVETLERFGYPFAVPIGMKQVAYPIIAGRSTDIFKINDLTEEHVVESVNAACGLYLREKDIPSKFVLAPSGSDDATFLGHADSAADVFETGRSLIKHIKDVRLVFENDEPAVVMYSTSFFLVHKDAYMGDKDFYYDYGQWIKEGVETLKNSEDPLVKDLFKDHFDGFPERFKEKEKELGLYEA